MSQEVVNLSGDRIFAYTSKQIEADLKLVSLDEAKPGFILLCPPEIHPEHQSALSRVERGECSILVLADGEVLREFGAMKRFCFIARQRMRYREIRLKAWAKKSEKFDAPPKTLVIEPTHLCNLKCPHCHTGLRDVERTDSKLGQTGPIEEIFESYGSGIESLILPFEGEPFLYPDLTFSIVKMAKKSHIKVDIATNAHFFSDEIVQGIVENKVDSITITVDGMTEETYRKYRVGGSFEKVKKGIERLVQEKNKSGSLVPHVRVQMIVMKHNEHEVTFFEDWAANLGVNSWALKTMNLISWEGRKDWLPSNPEFVRTRYKYSKPDEYQNTFNTEVSCNVAWDTMLITTDGVAVACCDDVQARHPMGNVLQSDFMDVWNGAKYSEFRSQLSVGINEHPMCKDCCKADFHGGQGLNCAKIATGGEGR